MWDHISRTQGVRGAHKAKKLHVNFQKNKKVFFLTYSGILFCQLILKFFWSQKKIIQKYSGNFKCTLCTRRIETFLKWLFLCHVHAIQHICVVLACMWHKKIHFKKVSILLVHSVDFSFNVILIHMSVEFTGAFKHCIYQGFCNYNNTYDT